MLLMDDFKIFPDSPWIQVLVGAGLELKGIMLEVLDAVSEEHLIGVVNRLNPFLGEEIFKIYEETIQTLYLMSKTIWNVLLIRSFILSICSDILSLESSISFRIRFM